MLKLNGVHITPTRFPDGTQQVWKLPDEAFVPKNDVHNIEWKFDSELELVSLMQLRYLLGLEANVHLIIPYLPYGRQDKEVSNDLTFAQRPFLAYLMEMIRPEKLTVFDPHSEELIENFCELYGCELEIFMPNIKPNEYQYDYIVFPDAGAATRYSTLIEDQTKIVVGNKVRNQLTGKIESYSLDISPEKLHGATVLVIDDLCDGGATFVILGESLKKNGVSYSDLYVSHGIFSSGREGFAKLEKYYQNIVTTNSLSYNEVDQENDMLPELNVIDWKQNSVLV